MDGGWFYLCRICYVIYFIIGLNVIFMLQLFLLSIFASFVVSFPVFASVFRLFGFLFEWFLSCEFIVSVFMFPY